MVAVSGKVQGKGNWKIWAGSQSLFGMRGTAAPAADAASADAHNRARMAGSSSFKPKRAM
jgi:hypothetical protein